ncbi:MAG: oligosaccharide flippase family protein [Faecalibacterium sp.]
MRQSYLKNAALLTGSDVVLRLAGMGLRIWLANELGGEGMGLYQLVLAVYSLFVTLATAGVSVAATRLMAEELSRDKAAARGMLVRLVLAGLRWAGLPWSPSLPPQVLRQSGGWGYPRCCRCAPRRWGCRGWRSRRCCAVFSSPGGM